MKHEACISMIISLVRGLRMTLEQSDEDRGACTIKFENARVTTKKI